MADSAELQRAFKNNLMCFSLGVSVIAIVIMIPGAIGFHKYQQLKENNCFINEIVYPTDYPTVTDHNDWLLCSNGGYTGCMKLYAFNLSYSVIKAKYEWIHLIHTNQEDNNPCTFRYGNCETSLTKMRMLIRSMSIKYNEVINTNKTCYKYEDTIYLDRYRKPEVVAIFVISLAILIICTIVVSVRACIIFDDRLIAERDRGIRETREHYAHRTPSNEQVPPKYDEISLRSTDPLEEYVQPPPIEEVETFVEIDEPPPMEDYPAMVEISVDEPIPNEPPPEYHTDESQI